MLDRSTEFDKDLHTLLFDDRERLGALIDNLRHVNELAKANNSKVDAHDERTGYSTGTGDPADTGGDQTAVEPPGGQT